MSLLNFLQAASNAVAGNVTGPVDLLALGLRKAGVPVGDAPIGGSEWARRVGLLGPVEQGASQVAGETMGLLAPVAVAAKAPQIARGLLQVEANAAAPGTMNAGLARGQRGAIPMGDLPDWIDDFKSIGGQLNPDGTVSVYHRTSKTAADNIRKTGLMRGKEDGLFFSSLPDGQASGFGDEVLEFRIPASQLSIDDLFDKEAHFRLPTQRALQSVRVDKWLKK